ncbi:MAG: hypothetical protein JWL85_787 [Candidatus Saccharibacteria bacterium]|nr:hypothetical protein [Candidatus Saccharibacteria bacterium]
MDKHKLSKVAKQSLLWLGIIAAIAILTYFAFYRPYEIKKDRENYTVAEAKVDEIAAQIEATIGKPISSHDEDTCHRNPLTCSTAKTLNYPVTSPEEAKQLVGKIKTAYPSAPQSSSEADAQHVTNIGELNCLAIHTLPNPTDFEGFTRLPILAIQISCSGPAKTDHYLIQSNG